MIGSPDLLAFTGTEGFGDGAEDREGPGLPEELSVAPVPRSNPWSSSAQFHRDFILVAEFSEQVGPQPILTIPDDHRVIGSFDLNHFSVRMMSVDYQASGPGHSHLSSPGLQLNFSEDSKVILGDSAEDAFAYVHHLTLYDLEARGMVRPFCMAYVCSDQAKLMENFSELSAGFSQASDSLKTGNRKAFSMGLQRKLQELESTRLSLCQEAEFSRTTNGFAEVEGKGNELEAVERSISNHRELLRQVAAYPNRKLKQPDFLPYDPADSLADPTALMPSEPCSSSLSTSSSHKSEHSLKSLDELCNGYFLSLMKEQLADTERRLRGDRSFLRTARVTRSLSRKLTLTSFLFELCRPEDMEEEEEEEEEMELKMASGSRSNGAGSRSEPPVLESFFSCVEEIPIKLEAGEAETRSPEPGTDTDMTGSLSSGDSIEVLSTEKSYRTQQVIAGPDSREQVVTSDASLRRDAGVRRVRAYAKRANSEDSIEVLSTTESIFPDDLTAITEEEAEQQTLVNGFKAAEEPQADRKSDRVLPEAKLTEEFTSSRQDGTEEPEAREGEGGYEEPVESLTETTVKDDDGVTAEEEFTCTKKKQVHKELSWDRTPKHLHVEEAVALTWPKVHQMVRLVPDLVMDFTPPLALTEVDHWAPPPPRVPLRLLSVDEAFDCLSFTSSLEQPSPLPNVQGATRSDRKRRRKAGLRALRFIKHNSFSQHAVFCLLSGRPLVVIGGDESLVRKQVDALSLFLPAPGPEGSAVMPCLTTPLQLADLITWRLIGIHRSPSSSSSAIVHSLTRYSRYLALLDLDQRTLRSLPYSGSLLSRMADPQSGISHGATYLLHLESCLTALANQVLLYTFEAASPQTREKDGAEDVLTAKGRLCSSESDRRVMRFLSDLMKHRHAGSGPPVLSFYYDPLYLHRNTYVT